MMKEAEATVTKRGGVLLGSHIICDGYEPSRQVGVVTHFHADHSNMLPITLRFSKIVLTTPATRDLLLVTRGETLVPYLERLRGLPYTESYKFDGERITLFPARHVLRSSQVLVETGGGRRLVYTGDFLTPGTLPVEADVVVVEAANGPPRASRGHDAIANPIADLTNRLLLSGPVSVVAHQGKLQEVMHILFESGIDVPFLAPADVFNVAEVYRRYGVSQFQVVVKRALNQIQIDENHSSRPMIRIGT